MATIKKAQNGTAQYSDPSPLFKKIQKSKDSISNARKNLNNDFKLKALKFQETKKQNAINNEREARKRADKNIEKSPRLEGKKMKNGGSLTGLKASNKRVGPVDPKGAYTTVQKRTLAGAKGKASLTKDKQLGATKMAKSGAKVSKKK